VLNGYEINDATVAIIPMGKDRSKVIEITKEILVSKPPIQIIKESCSYFGSTYRGRNLGTKELIGVTHKVPIIVEESKEIIFFPTMSPQSRDCSWISLKNIKNYMRNHSSSMIEFIGGYHLTLNISYGSLDSQILRAARLESVLRSRKVNS